MKQTQRSPETPANRTKPKPSKRQRRPSVGGESPSPFELAQTAIALCQLHGKDPQFLPPSDYFDEATALWTNAQNYLSPASQERRRLAGAGFLAEFLQTPEAYRNADKPIPFEWFLRPASHSSSSEKVPKRLARKKARTLVGAITTRLGLEKAIRRYLGADAARIIQAQVMMYPEYQRLVRAQQRAIDHRAAKRVKR